MKVSLRDLAFTIISGYVVQKIVDGEGMNLLDKLRRPKGAAPKPTMANMPEPILPERFATHPFAVYYERVVWNLSRDFDLPRIRQVRNFMNQHEYYVEASFHQKMPAEHVARSIDAMLEGKVPVPQHLDPKAAFMQRAERVLGAKPQVEAPSPLRDTKEGDSTTEE